jgi:hypothetical protein
MQTDIRTGSKPAKAVDSDSRRPSTSVGSGKANLSVKSANILDKLHAKMKKMNDDTLSEAEKDEQEYSNDFEEVLDRTGGDTSYADDFVESVEEESLSISTPGLNSASQKPSTNDSSLSRVMHTSQVSGILFFVQSYVLRLCLKSNLKIFAIDWKLLMQSTKLLDLNLEKALNNCNYNFY